MTAGQHQRARRRLPGVFGQQPATVAGLGTQLVKLRRAGTLPDPPVQLYPFADARSDLRAIADRKAQGKIVLSRQA